MDWIHSSKKKDPVDRWFKKIRFELKIFFMGLKEKPMIGRDGAKYTIKSKNLILARMINNNQNVQNKLTKKKGIVLRNVISFTPV